MEGIEPVIQIVSSLGVAAVLGWYLYYTTTVSFPKMNDQNLARMDAMADRQNKVVENVCNNFATSLKEERDFRRQEMLILNDEIRKLRGVSDTHREA